MSYYNDRKEGSPRSESSRDRKSKDRTEEEINDGTTLYVSNLSRHARTADLKDAFARYGEIIDCRVVRNPSTRETRGFGFVVFARPDECERLMDGRNEIELDGRRLSFELAKRKNPYPSTPGIYMGRQASSYGSRMNGSRRDYPGSRRRYDSSDRSVDRDRDRGRRESPRYRDRRSRRDDYDDRDSRRPRGNRSTRRGDSRDSYRSYNSRRR